MNTPTTGFNSEVYGTTGWPKFSVPMVNGGSATFGELSAALDKYVGIVKANGGGDALQYIPTFNALAYQLNAIAQLIVGGKGVI